MSDVINSIFGRPNSGTPASGGYGGVAPAAPADTAAPEIVDTEEIQAETTEPTEDAGTDVVTEEPEAATDSADAEVVETDTDDADADIDETDDEAVEDEGAEAEAVTEESDEAAADEDSSDSAADTVETEEAEVTEEAAPVVAEAEAEVVDEAERVVAAAARPAAGTRGATTIGDDVVVKIVYRVARKAEGVHELTSDDVEVAVDGDVATITISVVIDFGHAVKVLAEKIRTDVIEAVEQFLGLDVEGVDVHIADIHFPDAD
ncbi:Asp23/Gls24 family envelope stress response protein [Amycolatopsis sp. NBC_00355]|uniref:Asp23/Gls24 family envelope stress response protein n=1 Tax=Amycolatopsis sp. NBC_00355 TaxID=2975957 RepID=UPI002E259419